MATKLSTNLEFGENRLRTLGIFDWCFSLISSPIQAQHFKLWTIKWVEHNANCFLTFGNDSMSMDKQAIKVVANISWLQIFNM